MLWRKTVTVKWPGKVCTLLSHLCLDSQSPKLFPHLNTESLSSQEKEDLFARLRMQSGKMQDEFAILVDRVGKSLVNRKISAKDLRVLVAHSQKNKLFNLFKRKKSITKLFLELRNYWSFFDYEFLGVIIKSHCPELMSELAEYVSCFKKYCERRIYEVPVNAFGKEGDIKSKLYVKCDDNFDESTVGDVKELESRLSDLLSTKLYLLSVKEGCIKLVFNSLCDITVPVTVKQTQQLKKLGILSISHYETKIASQSSIPEVNISDYNIPENGI